MTDEWTDKDLEMIILQSCHDLGVNYSAAQKTAERALKNRREARAAALPRKQTPTSVS